MNSMIPEFTRPLATDRVPLGGMTITVAAEPGECAALAARLGVPAIEQLTCRFHLRPGRDGAIEAGGHLAARLTQLCSVSLDEFETDISEDFALRCVPAGRETDDPDPDAVDEFVVVAGLLDLGEATTEQLALALDPYPRKPGAALQTDAADLPTSPFAGLARPGRVQ